MQTALSPNSISYLSHSWIGYLYGTFMLTQWGKSSRWTSWLWLNTLIDSHPVVSLCTFQSCICGQLCLTQTIIKHLARCLIHLVLAGSTWAGTHLLFQHHWFNLQGGCQPQHGFQFGKVRRLKDPDSAARFEKLPAKSINLCTQTRAYNFCQYNHHPYHHLLQHHYHHCNEWQVWWTAPINSLWWAWTSAHGGSVGQRWKHRPHSSSKGDFHSAHRLFGNLVLTSLR